MSAGRPRRVVRIDRETCLSSGRCVEDAPAAFRFGEDDLAEVTPGAAALSAERLESVAFGCPAAAITLEEVAWPGESPG